MLRSGAVALILLLAGCSGNGTSVSGPPKFGDQSELIASLTVTPLTFQAGDTVQIDVGLRNPTPYPIVMGFTSGCQLSYLIADSSGVFVAPNFACTANTPTIEMAPGQTIAARLSWDGTQYGRPFPPGPYRVSSSGFLIPSVTPVTIRIVP
jgi:hypothetical protein